MFAHFTHLYYKIIFIACREESIPKKLINVPFKSFLTVRLDDGISMFEALPMLNLKRAKQISFRIYINLVFI